MYIGQTSRVLRDRLNSHKSDCRLNKRSCALAEHVIDTGHEPNYLSVSTLHTENNLTKSLFLEMVETHLENNSMNIRRDISDLSAVYAHLITMGQTTTISADLSLNSSGHSDSTT